VLAKHSPGRAYFDRKISQGKPSKEALRAWLLRYRLWGRQYRFGQ
jgi:hypothetical protein